MIRPHFIRNQHKKLTLSNPKRALAKENQPFSSQINVKGIESIKGIQVHQSNLIRQKSLSTLKITRETKLQEWKKSRSISSHLKTEKTNEQAIPKPLNGRKILSVDNREKIDKPNHELISKKGNEGTIRPSEIQEICLQIINFLKKQNILQSSHLKNYTIRKTDFQQTLISIFSCFWSKSKQNNMGNAEVKESVNLESAICQKISQFFEKQVIMLKKVNLQKVPQTIKFTSIIYDYQNELSKFKNEISFLLSEKQALSVEIKAIQAAIQQFKRQIILNRQQINSQIVMKNNLIGQISILQQKKTQILQDITKNSHALQMAKLTEEKITNYVNIQTNRLIKMASEDYKQVESDIYEYASYLQSNQLAHDLDFEPLPFRNLQEEVSESVKKISRILLQTDQDKSQIMKDFIVTAAQRFKKKDTQMIKLLQFKTKCIRNFISNMKKWLDNWTLKQEYLVNLRNQFYIDTQKISNQVNAINSLPLCEGCKGMLNKDFCVLVDYYKKVQLNYKMGNSFY